MGHLPAGETYNDPVIQLDILPTALAAAGAPASEDAKLDGVDLLPYLTGKETGPPHETLYWRFGDQWAVRHGDWKLVGGGGGDLAGELYNIAKDKAESENLAGESHEKVTELKSLWDQWNKQQAPPSAPKEPPNRAKRRNQRQRAAKPAAS